MPSGVPLIQVQVLPASKTWVLPQSRALRVLACMGLALMLFLSGMWAGHDVATAQADARQAKAALARLKACQGPANPSTGQP